jgi:ATP-binding cassette subfamily F protein uup
MSYTERRALELLPARMASLEARIEALNDVLADPDLYAHDRARFEATSSALAAAREELAAAEEQWLALEMRREEIEGPRSSD